MSTWNRVIERVDDRAGEMLYGGSCAIWDGVLVASTSIPPSDLPYHPYKSLRMQRATLFALEDVGAVRQRARREYYSINHYHSASIIDGTFTTVLTFTFHSFRSTSSSPHPSPMSRQPTKQARWPSPARPAHGINKWIWDGWGWDTCEVMRCDGLSLEAVWIQDGKYHCTLARNRGIRLVQNNVRTQFLEEGISTTCSDERQAEEAALEEGADGILDPKSHPTFAHTSQKPPCCSGGLAASPAPVMTMQCLSASLQVRT